MACPRCPWDVTVSVDVARASPPSLPAPDHYIAQGRLWLDVPLLSENDEAFAVRYAWLCEQWATWLEHALCYFIWTPGLISLRASFDQTEFEAMHQFADMLTALRVS